MKSHFRNDGDGDGDGQNDVEMVDARDIIVAAKSSCGIVADMNASQVKLQSFLKEKPNMKIMILTGI